MTPALTMSRAVLVTRQAAGIDARIKAAHDAHGCTTWETWTSRERDQHGRLFDATWDGCRACGVAILQPEPVWFPGTVGTHYAGRPLVRDAD